MKFLWFEKAKQDLKKLNKAEQTRIIKKLMEISKSSQPLHFFNELKEDLVGCHKIRIGKNRVITLLISGDVAKIILIQTRGKVYSSKIKKQIVGRIEEEQGSN